MVIRGAKSMKLPSLSIAAKLYTIFALLATATVILSLLAALNSRHNTALTDEFERAFMGAMNVERVNGLIYAVVMESRGIYMSPDIPTAKRYGDAAAAIQRAHRERGCRLAQACGQRRCRAVR